MENYMDFIFETGITIYKTSDGFIGIIFIVFLIGFIVITAKFGFGGLGFWGKNREKIAEYTFNNDNCTRKIFVYKLKDKKGCEGYGIEFSETETMLHGGGAKIKGSHNFVEFTKNEADMIVKLVAPHMEKTSA